MERNFIFRQTRNRTYPAGSYEWKILQDKVIESGEIIYSDTPLADKQKYYLNNLGHLNETEKRIINPHYYKVDISDQLYDLKMKLINNIINEIKTLNNGKYHDKK